MDLKQKKKNFDTLLAQFYAKLDKIKTRRINLVKKIDQQKTSQNIQEVEDKIKNL